MLDLQAKAGEILAVLQSLPGVKSCTLYGSLAQGTADEFSDIDIAVDVSGCDNGRFLLDLPELLCGKLPVLWADFAPSLIPESYIVSLALDVNNPFLILDIRCTAEPHCTTVTRQDASARNTLFVHTLKVWTANAKHFIRGTECLGDIVRMANRLKIGEIHAKTEAVLLEESLCWLENNADAALAGYVQACRRVWDEKNHL